MGQVIHLLFSWSSFLSWTLFLVDLLLIGFLSLHAYQDGESGSDVFQHFVIDRSLVLINFLASS